MKKIFSRRDPLISLGATNSATTEKESIKVRKNFDQEKKLQIN